MNGGEEHESEKRRKERKTNNTFGFLLFGAGGAKPEAFGDAGEDRTKAEDMKPKIAFVAEEELFG